MVKNTQKKITDPVTLKDLGEFTEQVILPGVERIVDGKIDDLKEDIKSSFGVMRTEMKQGFSEVAKSIRVLSGDIAEVNENQKEAQEKNEARFLRLESKVGIQNR
ncbi:MAG: hypothetical protein UW30_C0006G0003 [Candidatus Giovannonibacteria bacterium GW2011_GWA2_44_13b]|uniref:Uncharacterized protein n=2 Tax=Candidatus Giovannoniibacteriota TaxID=1752738 RepID=A0A0G1H2E2_9BACT|nr:MAG: hypothetical protein UW30_C0006G0003 [Candidatus Giovannonibacteria bacterium GW2011_GWA2_44_13b]OGF82961.1 MAG: hypothetical protein A2924_04390 [Candidatus Giovannonibacteria bacterium RIFCSPLOWO2_01_FULL_44_16]